MGIFLTHTADARHAASAVAIGHAVAMPMAVILLKHGVELKMNDSANG